MFKSSDGKVLADLDVDGAVFIAARGGAGGKGNRYFATDVNQAPEIAEYGANGEEFTYTIEIRTIANVGLVISRSVSKFRTSIIISIHLFLRLGSPTQGNRPSSERYLELGPKLHLILLQLCSLTLVL